MDIVGLMGLLSPCLPFLLKLGEKSAEGAANKIGEDTWNKAKKIWEKLQPQVEAKEDAKIAAQQLVAKPESKARKAVFQEELETLLQENPSLAEAIAQILEEGSPKKESGSIINQKIQGKGHQTIGYGKGNQIISSVDSVSGGISGPTSGK
ncbi:hypothetical protein ACP6PL_01695 [Dapis sp. BLCC M126]|uniref:hypothetical protein n=1 Tax=Dapis sp. BLCC M126 TaxID=3400189 RepID=UPI003CF6DBE0